MQALKQMLLLWPMSLLNSVHFLSTQPLRVKGWDKALLEYTLAMVTDSASEPKPPLANRLTEISCPGIVTKCIQPSTFNAMKFLWVVCSCN